MFYIVKSKLLDYRDAGGVDLVQVFLQSKAHYSIT